jgi:RecQ family ATP-dependent DNA helicase
MSHFKRIKMFSKDQIKKFAQDKGFNLKDIQLLSIENVLKKKDTFVIAKTGIGKSLIFQVATSMFNTNGIGITIIVSPLIALMMDQVRAAAPYGSAVFLGSAQEDKQAECHLESYKFIFMAPEKLQQSNIQKELKRLAPLIFLIVIDEVHTQVTWQGFRPAFAEIPTVLQNVFDRQRPPLLMLTATLTNSQQAQLLNDFNISADTQTFRASCDRGNLSIQIIDASDKIAKLLEHARASQKKGNLCLIYVATPMDCQTICNKLKEADKDSQNKLRIRVYHGAGNSGKCQILDDRTETLQLATDKKLDVCICTSAFAMGIDIPNIDFVGHLMPPRSLADFAQQIGRAGRDGNEAVAVMLFHPSNIAQCFSLWVANKNAQIMMQNFEDFQNMMSFIYSSKCRRKFVRKVLENIDESAPLDVACNCDACEETHIIQRDIEPAMRLLLSAFKEHAYPVCISRISDKLFAHAPKHKGQWDDTKSPMWGKGKQIFAPTKQNDIWSSLAAVAVYELKFLVPSLHSHLAPPSGHVVAYQRLSLTDEGRSFLSSDAQHLLVRERFVPVSSWTTIAPRCTSLGCTNKGVRSVGNELFCTKHASIPGDCVPASSSFVSQAHDSQTPVQPTHHAPFCADSVPPTSGFVSQAPGAVLSSQCTPPGFLTQDMLSCFQSGTQPALRQLTQPFQGQYTAAGTYSVDVKEHPDALHNPYMGNTYSSTLASGAHVKVRDATRMCLAMFAINFTLDTGT